MNVPSLANMCLLQEYEKKIVKTGSRSSIQKLTVSMKLNASQRLTVVGSEVGPVLRGLFPRMLRILCSLVAIVTAAGEKSFPTFKGNLKGI